jgi:hypothetical protein
MKSYMGMRIDIIVNRVDGGWSPLDTRLGGTEESIVHWATWLVKLGHEVRVFHNNHDPNMALTYKSVDYLPRYTYEHDGDVCINVKSTDIPRGNVPTVYYTNETNAPSLDLAEYDMVIWPSDYARQNYPVNNPKVRVVPHGYNPTSLKPRAKVPLSCLYASSPDRGLDTLERIWPSIVDEFPQAHLYVTYGGKLDLPNTTSVILDEKQMDELYGKTDFWLYPMNESAIELYCMTGKKAQVAGAIPVIIPRMALHDTVTNGFFAEDDFSYYEELRSALLLGTEGKEDVRKIVMANAKAHTWQQSTIKLLDLLKQIR